jgi:hypothetical protein
MEKFLFPSKFFFSSIQNQLDERLEKNKLQERKTETEQTGPMRNVSETTFFRSLSKSLSLSRDLRDLENLLPFFVLLYGNFFFVREERKNNEDER